MNIRAIESLATIASSSVPRTCIEFEVRDTGSVATAGKEHGAPGFTLVLLSITLGVGAAGCAGDGKYAASALDHAGLRDRGSATPLADIAERDEVRTVVTRLSHEVDRRRWAQLRSLFADTVTADYRSLFGGEVRQQKADDLIEGWRKAFTLVDTTQHILGPVDVDVQGATATARCHVRAYHIRQGLPGGDEWLVAGNYVIELAKADGGWKIHAMKLETSYQSGNRKLLEEAGALAAAR
jgi:hypothetical protein